MHEFDLPLTLAIGFSVALIFGYVTQKLRLSPILGYLLAGIVVGPHTPGLVVDANLAAQMAEIGVILLMFGVGLHFHLKDLLAVRGIAIPGAIVQSFAATALGALVAWHYGWGVGAGLVLGLAISVASTVVLLRVLMDNDALDTPQGHIAVGWLIVEDIFTVLVLVLLPIAATSFRGGGGSFPAVAASFGIALAKLALLAVLVLGLGSKVIPWLLIRIARTRSRELFTLAVLAIALAIAAGSAHFFGASMALGAFLAGMVVGQSKVSAQAAADALPMRDAFAVLFFVSVGMLFDPRFIVAQPGMVAAVLGIVLLAKPAAALLIVLLLGYSMRTALTVAAALAQIGEFSFILATAATKVGLLPGEGQSVLVAAALFSISLNPLLFRGAGVLERALRKSAGLWAFLNRKAEARGRGLNAVSAGRMESTPDQVRAVVVGYGPVGRTLTRILQGFGIRPVIIDLNVDTVAKLVSEGATAIYGDAGKAEILKAAGIERAKYLLATLPDLDSRAHVISAARGLNPDVTILSRARYLTEREPLEQLGVTAVCYEEAEAAVGLSKLLLRAEGAPAPKIATEADRIRREFAPTSRGSRRRVT